ncbi:39S ribosomal protein L10, mitochondrial [Episyrphus balteatus]|uniref:39S ribosomal protein L10, mitochondrial n=1 Tax=Episyrphus balteatus TaxID=286459 RepID=UPI0024855625|nr:39S ribosomal protein L10, mitochondrial [Episyrphus balteatus]XP_055858192.1 39S ribosomal protein L10, mitochondrial [Episyrphus balteatus]
MSYLVKQVLLQSRTPLVQFQRFRGKINIQRPQKPHYERARVTAVTQPIYDKPPPEKNCFKKALKTDTINPYDKIIAKEVFNWLEHSKMVGIFHLNPISEDELFKIRVALHRQNITFKRYGKKIIKMAVDNTKYEAIVPLFDSNHCIVFSPEQNVATLIKITRKVPQMLLLGGILENRLLSRNEFMNFANLPNLQVAQAQFVSVLNMAAGQLVQNLEAHQNSFVNILDVYAKQGVSESGDATPEVSVEAASMEAEISAKESKITEVKDSTSADEESAKLKDDKPSSKKSDSEEPKE